MAKHGSNTIIKFADDTTVVGLITDNNEAAYKEEVRDLEIILRIVISLRVITALGKNEQKKH